MNKFTIAELQKFFNKGYRVFSIAEIALAPWNYKQDDDEKAKKLLAKLKRNGQIVNITIREYPADEPHERPYEVVDGNHRLIALQELGYEGVIAVNRGVMTKAEAMRLAMEINEGDFEPNIIKASKNIQEMLKEFSFSDLLETLPYSHEQLEHLSQLTEFDWSRFDAPSESQQKGDQDGDEIIISFSASPEQAAIIYSEVDRLKSALALKDDGAAFAKMAENSASLP